MTHRDGITRRQFMANASAVAVAARALAEKPPSPFRFSVSTIMYPECSFETAIEEIAKTGCHAVDLWEGSARMPTDHMLWVEKHRGDWLRRFLENFGLEPYSFSIYWTPANKRLERLEWLKEAGGKVAVLGGGARAGRPVEAGVRALQSLVEKAEQLGLRIAGENHGGSSLHSVQSMREFVALAKSPALGIALAPFHVMGAKESVSEAIEAIGSKLFFFYAWQRAPGMRQLPGDETLDFLPVLNALRKVRYNCYLNIFTHAHVPKDEMTRSVIASREYLERVAQGRLG